MRLSLSPVGPQGRLSCGLAWLHETLNLEEEGEGKGERSEAGGLGRLVLAGKKERATGKGCEQPWRGNGPPHPLSPDPEGAAFPRFGDLVDGHGREQ